VSNSGAFEPGDRFQQAPSDAVAKLFHPARIAKSWLAQLPDSGSQRWERRAPQNTLNDGAAGEQVRMRLTQLAHFGKTSFSKVRLT